MHGPVFIMMGVFRAPMCCPSQASGRESVDREWDKFLPGGRSTTAPHTSPTVTPNNGGLRHLATGCVYTCATRHQPHRKLDQN